MSQAALKRPREIGGYPIDPRAPLLQVEDLSVEFRTSDGIMRAVNGISYELIERETLAILGESGSGKSVSAQAVMGILDTPPGFITGGRVLFRGIDLFELPENERRRIRGDHIAMVFQDAMTSLNPLFTVGWQIGEMFRTHAGASRREAKAKTIDLMERVRIPSAKQRVDAYPYELSGGMRQRVMIAMAMALDPDVLIADEPTTALDVTVQAQIMELLGDLQEETGMGIILITHDLALVAEVADRVAVVYAGKIVEKGPTREVYRRPSHPYTLGLMHSIPRADSKGQRLSPIAGAPPDILAIPEGCSFHPRCPYLRDRCRTDQPPLYKVDDHRRISACHFYREVLSGHG